MLQALLHRLWKPTGRFAKRVVRWSLIWKGEAIWFVTGLLPSGIVTSMIKSWENHRLESRSCEVGVWLSRCQHYEYLARYHGLTSMWSQLGWHVNSPNQKLDLKGKDAKAEKTLRRLS